MKHKTQDNQNSKPKMKNSKLIPKRFFSVKEAAVYSSISTRLIYQTLKEQGIRSYRVGRKIVLDIKDLDAFIMANEVKNSDQIRQILKEKLSGKRRQVKK